MNCEVCSKPLPPYSGKGRPRKVCSSRCHAWRYTHPGGERPSWLTERHCMYCSALIVSPDVRLKFCDEACRRRFAAGSSVGKVRTCRLCDAEFTVSNGKQLYCSPECRLKYNRQFGSSTALRRQARQRGAKTIGRFTMRDIVRRDGWVCMLCFGPIDWRIRGDRYQEATVDHIVPITAGGEHTLLNAQLAHWTCNAAKRDSTDVVTMSVPEPGRKRVIVRWPVEAPPQNHPGDEFEPIKARAPRG